MPDYDPDERFSLYPDEPEEVLTRLLGGDDGDDDEAPEGDDS